MASGAGWPETARSRRRSDCSERAGRPVACVAAISLAGGGQVAQRRSCSMCRRNSARLRASVGWICPRRSGGRLSSSEPPRPTEGSRGRRSCGGRSSRAHLRRRGRTSPGRIETSHSAGSQCVPGRSPAFSRAWSASPGTKSSRSSVAQHVSPASPRSLPTQRTSGPASLKMHASGCSSRTICHVSSQP